MKFGVFIALVGAASAARGNWASAQAAAQAQAIANGQASAQAAAQAQAASHYAAPAATQYSCDCVAPLAGATLRGALDAGSRLPTPLGCNDGYGTLSAESAASETSIGAAQVAIPDKNIITDQAKVNEAVARGNRKSQTCQVAQRKFSIAGEISVTEKYNDSLKGDNTSESCGQGASQTRSRTQLLNAAGRAQIPVTTQCAPVQTCGCNVVPTSCNNH